MSLRPALLLFALLALAPVPAEGLGVHYRITATINDKNGTITGRETISIHNDSRLALPAFWVHVYPNAFRDNTTDFAHDLARSGRFGFALAPASEHGSATVANVTAEPGHVFVDSTDRTEMIVVPDSSLANGESLTLSMGFTTRLPRPFGELGRKGRALLLAHWYPQLAAFHAGFKTWDAIGYHLYRHSESEPADYDVTLTLPADMAIATNGVSDDSSATGSLEWSRWPPGMRKGASVETKTLHFTASDVSDFALVAAPDLMLLVDSAAGANIRIFARYPVKSDWLGAAARVRDMVQTFAQWYGPPPFRQLTVVQADKLAPADYSYPGLIVFSQSSIPATRLFEQALCRQVALQWFGASSDLGPAVDAEIRYMELRHGKTNLIDQPLLSRLLSGFSAEYYHRLYDYVAATNGLLLQPWQQPRDAFEYGANNVSHAGLLFTALRKQMGADAFDSLMRTRPSPAVLQSTIANLQSTIPRGLWHDTKARKLAITPLFNLPSFDEYQLFYGPYAWYDAYHGFQLAGWAMGRRFIDTGPLRGSHQWTFTETYFTKLDDWHSSLWYQTPLYFITPRTRVVVRGDYSELTTEARVGFQQEFGRVFGKPNALAELNYRLVDMRSTRLRKPEAWDIARTADVRFQLTHNYETVRFLGHERVFLARGLAELGGNYDYWKLWLDQTHTFRLNRSAAIRLRAFAGAVIGSVPNQDQYYLSGGLTTNPDEPVSWSYQGISSGQEHWHYDGDCNLRGYSGRYLHDKYGWALNLYLQPIPQLQPFLDVGNIGASLDDPGLTHPVMDAGLRIKLGPLYADFPLWVSKPDPGQSSLAFRWMLGFRLSDLLGS